MSYHAFSVVGYLPPSIVKRCYAYHGLRRPHESPLTGDGQEL